jgi:hypothetical protein
MRKYGAPFFLQKITGRQGRLSLPLKLILKLLQHRKPHTAKSLQKEISSNQPLNRLTNKITISTGYKLLQQLISYNTDQNPTNTVEYTINPL